MSGKNAADESVVMEIAKLANGKVSFDWAAYNYFDSMTPDELAATVRATMVPGKRADLYAKRAETGNERVAVVNSMAQWARNTAQQIGINLRGIVEL